MAQEGVERRRGKRPSCTCFFENKAKHDAIWPGAAEAARHGEGEWVSIGKGGRHPSAHRGPWTPYSGFTAGLKASSDDSRIPPEAPPPGSGPSPKFLQQLSRQESDMMQRRTQPKQPSLDRRPRSTRQETQE